MPVLGLQHSSVLTKHRNPRHRQGDQHGPSEVRYWIASTTNARRRNVNRPADDPRRMTRAYNRRPWELLSSEQPATVGSWW